MTGQINWKNEVVLITGASSGLGKALALRAAERGSEVVMVSRNDIKLSKVRKQIESAGGRGKEFGFDLSEIEKISSLFDKILQTVGRSPSILINNAGYNAPGFIKDTPMEVFEKNYRVNTLAPVALIQKVLPEMIKNRHGVIANIMSAAMYHSFPGMSSYCVSKIALGTFHESLEAELHGTSVKTLYINPGAFTSNYFNNMCASGVLRDYKFECKVPNEMKKPEFVAEKILKAIGDGKTRLDLSTWKDMAAYHLNYWFPGFIDKMIIKSNRKLLDFAFDVSDAGRKKSELRHGEKK